MSKNKKIFISVLIIVLLIILLVIFSPKLVKRLTGSVAGAQKEVKNEQVNEVCNKDITSDYFITLSGKIIQDFGEEGMATITIKNDNLVFTKEIEVNSNKFNKFNYVLPRGNYDVTVTKDGYKTYETEISESKNLSIVLTSNQMGDIVASGRTYGNTYYDYYSDGTVHLKTIGNLKEDEIENPDFMYSVLWDALDKYFENNGLSGWPELDDSNELSNLLVSSIISNVVSNTSINDGNVRDMYVTAYEKIESGECNANNMNDEGCDFDQLLLNELFENASFDDVKKYIKLIIDMPVQSNLIIDDNVVILPTLHSVVANELTIGNFIMPAASRMQLSTAKIGTLIVNSNQIVSSYVFASGSQINNLVIGEGVTVIGERAFYEATIDNITLPSTLTKIGVSAFEDANINAITIPENVTTINERAFQDATLTEVKLPSGLTSIGQYAFYGTELTSITIPESVASIGERAFSNTPLTEVIIEGDQTRFNSNWTRIGFPESLKPSN